jgi:NTP pyrophosphatase (non-canonical NTP hydrolase)
MEFSELKQKILENAARYEEDFKFTIDEEVALLKLYEELGEFTQAVLIHRKKSRPEKFLPEDQSLEKVAEELADVMGMVLVNADRLGIDLEKALQKKWIKKYV